MTILTLLNGPCGTTADQAAIRTDNLDLAAYLVATGHALHAVEHGDRWRRTFAFDPSSAEAIERFESGATVVARDYAIALRTLKALVHL